MKPFIELRKAIKFAALSAALLFSLCASTAPAQAAADVPYAVYRLNDSTYVTLEIHGGAHSSPPLVDPKWIVTTVDGAIKSHDRNPGGWKVENIQYMHYPGHYIRLTTPPDDSGYFTPVDPGVYYLHVRDTMYKDPVTGQYYWRCTKFRVFNKEVAIVPRGKATGVGFYSKASWIYWESGNYTCHPNHGDWYASPFVLGTYAGNGVGVMGQPVAYYKVSQTSTENGVTANGWNMYIQTYSVFVDPPVDENQIGVVTPGAKAEAGWYNLEIWSCKRIFTRDVYVVNMKL